MRLKITNARKARLKKEITSERCGRLLSFFIARERVVGCDDVDIQTNTPAVPFQKKKIHSAFIYTLYQASVHISRLLLGKTKNPV